MENRMAITKAGILCESCGWEALTDDETQVVICQNPKCMINGKFKQIQPKCKMTFPDRR